jgi:hypothetical protein
MKLSKTLKLTLRNLLLNVKMGEINTKENTLIFDGEEYEVGTEVFVNDTENEGEVIVAPDGEYTVIEEDKEVKVLVVREGKIEEIKETETETTTEEEVEAEETVVVVEPIEETEKSEEENKGEDRIAALEARMEEVLAGLTEIVNKFAAMEGRIEVLEEKLAKVEAPAAEPAEEEKPAEEETKMSKLGYLRKK